MVFRPHTAPLPWGLTTEQGKSGPNAKITSRSGRTSCSSAFGLQYLHLVRSPLGRERHMDDMWCTAGVSDATRGLNETMCRRINAVNAEVADDLLSEVSSADQDTVSVRSETPGFLSARTMRHVTFDRPIPIPKIMRLPETVTMLVAEVAAVPLPSVKKPGQKSRRRRGSDDDGDGDKTVSCSIGRELYTVPKGMTRHSRHNFIVESRIQKCLEDKNAYREAIERGRAAQQEQRRMKGSSFVERHVAEVGEFRHTRDRQRQEAKERNRKKLEEVSRRARSVLETRLEQIKITAQLRHERPRSPPPVLKIGDIASQK